MGFLKGISLRVLRHHPRQGRANKLKQKTFYKNLAQELIENVK